MENRRAISSRSIAVITAHAVISLTCFLVLAPTMQQIAMQRAVMRAEIAMGVGAIQNAG